MSAHRDRILSHVGFRRQRRVFDAGFVTRPLLPLAIRALALRPILVLARPADARDACIKNLMRISNYFLGGTGT